MSTVVFGPHSTGLSLFGLHIPLVTTEVDRAATGTIPGSLTVKGTGPTGQQATCTVANGSSMTVPGIGSLNAVYAINDCRTVPASGNTPEEFIFRVTIRAEGTISVKLIPIPVNVQVDSFEVTLATSTTVNDDLRTSQFAMA